MDCIYTELLYLGILISKQRKLREKQLTGDKLRHDHPEAWPEMDSLC